MSDAGQNKKLDIVITKHGFEGYGYYWRIIEMIASQMEEKDKYYCEYTEKYWANIFRTYPKHWRKIVETLANVGLIFLEDSKKISESTIIISCPNINKYRDEWSRKKLKTPESLRINSGQTPEQEVYNKEVYKEEKDFKDSSVSFLSSSFSSHTTHSTCITPDEELKNEKLHINEKKRKKKLPRTKSHNHDIELFDDSNNIIENRPDENIGTEQPEAKKSKLLKFSDRDFEIASDYSKWLIENQRVKAHTKPTIEKWADSIRMMREIDNRSILDIEMLVDFVKHDSFWFDKVLSLSAMRDKQDKLFVAMDRKNKGGNYGGGRTGFNQGSNEKFDIE